MAKVVWETLELYRLKGRIITITMDNASNNDTMMTTLEVHCYAEGIRFQPETLRLEAIGAISKRDSKKSAACGGNYQDEVTVWASDNGNACADDKDCEENVFEAISKLHKVIQVVHSSPQRQQSWLQEVWICQDQMVVNPPDAL
ncbi:hypothetical protein F5148DRAFT_1153180 [Russula earlei]|uniref:Uncharacterized protein n=1 Tax=Russula earlei TaxID=71964 RepID=A0ACC0TU44_9AGAM|nr:hypothetical protein F5148DRAFT_1153180 [Russula earlei]